MYTPTQHPRNKVFTYWIDIVGTCNLRCPTCPTGNFLDTEFSVGRNPTGFMDYELYVSILNKIRDDNDPMGKDVEAFWIRNNDWFYKKNLTDQNDALYDINNDPFCNKNVILENPIIAQNFSKIISQRYKD